MARNEYMGNLIQNSLGRVEEVDLEEGEMACGEFMGVRVHVNVTKPLLQGKKINLGLPKPVWVSFKYAHRKNYAKNHFAYKVSVLETKKLVPNQIEDTILHLW